MARGYKNPVKMMEKAKVPYNCFGRIDILEKNRWMCKKCGRVYGFKNGAQGCEHHYPIGKGGVERIEPVE